MLKKSTVVLLLLFLLSFTACSNKKKNETPTTILEQMKTNFDGTVYLEGDEWYHDRYVFSDYLDLFIGFYEYSYSYNDFDAMANSNSDFIIFPYSKLYLRYADYNFNTGYKRCSTGVLYNDAFSIMSSFRLALGELEIYENRISAFNNFILGTGTYQVTQLNNESFMLEGNKKIYKFTLIPKIPDNVVTSSSNNLLSTEGKWIKR